MTVEELIEALKKMPQDYIVFLDDSVQGKRMPEVKQVQREGDRVVVWG